MLEGRAREDSILLRLVTITAAVEQQSEAVKACPAAFPKALPAIPTVDLPLPADDLRCIESHHRLEKLQSLKEAADNCAEGVKARAATKVSGKSRGSVRLSRKRLVQVETQLIKESIGSQGSCSDIIAGGQAECDVVVFPHSLASVQVQLVYCCVLQSIQCCLENLCGPQCKKQ